MAQQNYLAIQHRHFPRGAGRLRLVIVGSRSGERCFEEPLTATIAWRTEKGVDEKACQVYSGEVAKGGRR